MNIKLIFWIIGILISAVVAGVVWYMLFIPQAVPQTVGPGTTLPVSGTINPTTTTPASSTPSQQSNTLTLTTQNNGTAIANDFIHNGVTIPDTVNVGGYLLAGNLGYCLSDPQQCQAAPASNFTVYYNSVPQSFTIDLTQEPMGQARLDMEQFMLADLGLTPQQLCSLNYYVGVTIYVNEQFTGKNLGFSFCPGATVLPK